MSKQQDAKKKQGYNPKYDPKTCGNCIHFQSEFIKTRWGFNEEKNLRCKIGEFAVKKMGTCNMFERKEGSNEQQAK